MSRHLPNKQPAVGIPLQRPCYTALSPEWLVALGVPINDPIDRLPISDADPPHFVAKARLLALNSDFLKETNQGHLQTNTVALILIYPGPSSSTKTPAPTRHCRPTTRQLSLTCSLHSRFSAACPIYVPSLGSTKCQSGKQLTSFSNTSIANDDCISTEAFSP